MKPHLNQKNLKKTIWELIWQLIWHILINIYVAASQKSLHQITYTSPVVTKLSWPVLTTLIMAPCAQRRFFSDAWSSLASWPGQHTIPLVA